LDDTNLTMSKQAVYHAHLENTNTLKEKKSVQIVRWDARRTLSVTMKANVCCVPLVKKLHELVVQSVKIVVLADMVTVAKNVKLANTAPLHRMILRHVLHAVLDGINQTRDKQAVFRARRESTNILKEKRNV
jgi:hypothetical protein